MGASQLGEALALDWRDVDLSRAHVAFLDTKNGDRRGAPLHPRAVAAIASLQHRTGNVFRRPDGQAYAPKDGEGGQIKQAFKGACRWASLTNFRPHDCRPTWATWHYMANRDLGTLMEIGGWKTVSLVMSVMRTSIPRTQPQASWGSGDGTGTLIQVRRNALRL
jgi:integrase